KTKTAESKTETKKPTLDLEVGKIIRLPSTQPHNHALWRVTGIHYGATQCENLITIRRLDINAGSAHGKTQHESVVPIAILGTHPLLENV
ncbi:MAG: hypothetical protein KGL39_60005, partial [Patescibacteria group bacterium]|nr:hypothetical protein [Patescibacteria group bacterium]